MTGTVRPHSWCWIWPLVVLLACSPPDAESPTVRHILGGQDHGGEVPLGEVVSDYAPAQFRPCDQTWAGDAFPVSILLQAEDGCRSDILEYLDASVEAIHSTAGRIVFSGVKCGPPLPGFRGVQVVIGSLDSEHSLLGQTRTFTECDRWSSSGCERPSVVGATVVIQDPSDRNVLSHELLHALGMGHSCLARSVMATEFQLWELRRCSEVRSGLGYSQALRLERRFGPVDAAAIQLLLGGGPSETTE